MIVPRSKKWGSGLCQANTITPQSSYSCWYRYKSNDESSFIMHFYVDCTIRIVGMNSAQLRYYFILSIFFYEYAENRASGLRIVGFQTE